MGPRLRPAAVAVSGFFFVLASASAVRGEAPGAVEGSTLSVLGIWGQNFLAGRHGFSETLLPTVDYGKFVSRRLEIGFDVHPWIYIKQSVNDNGDGGYETATAFAFDGYVRWYPAPFSWKWQPFLEDFQGPFYANRRVPAAGSRFNFLTQFGAGTLIPLAGLRPWSLVAGYRWVHISNAGLYRRNPSWDFNTIVIGLRKTSGP